MVQNNVASGDIMDYMFSLHTAANNPNYLKENGRSYVFAVEPLTEDQSIKLGRCRDIVEAQWHCQIHMICGLCKPAKDMFSVRLFEDIHLLMPEHFHLIEESPAMLYSESLMPKCLLGQPPVKPLSVLDMIEIYENEGLVVAAQLAE